MCANHERYADDLRVFVKPEPHKITKLEEGRLRLISAVSFVDTMVDRILFGWLADVALSSTWKTPCMVGWSPIKGGWRAMANRFVKPMALDRSAWDWTVQQWLVEAWLGFIFAVAIDPPDWWIAAVTDRFEMLFFHARFRFQDGTVIKQPRVGIMKSGCYLTLLLNSVSQVIIHAVAMLQLGLNPFRSMPLAFGDDTIQESEGLDVNTYIAELSKLGPKLKSPRIARDVEFIGFLMGEKFTPAYTSKHLYKLEYSERLPEYLESMQCLYAHHPTMQAVLRRIAARRCPEVVLPTNYVLAFAG
uniref:RNA-dependent RNA polymerase n=1 Tax=Soybean thrips sobemo-like virus 7 TaxID=2801037 RepID=A0A7T8IMM5_9VIRU|nr:RNA-dependent RNA polymerase [Soybean thrips sobemo-like virus 7]